MGYIDEVMLTFKYCILAEDDKDLEQSKVLLWNQRLKSYLVTYVELLSPQATQIIQHEHYPLLINEMVLICFKVNVNSHCCPIKQNKTLNPAPVR